MTDRHRVYTKVKKTLKQIMKLDHQGQVVTLAMMIAGIVMSRKAQLSEMSSEIPTETKEKSVEMRMRRWVKADLDVEGGYMPFARQILRVLSHSLGVGDGWKSSGTRLHGADGRCLVSKAGVADRLAGV